jgi:hypothetical protein
VKTSALRFGSFGAAATAALILIAAFFVVARAAQTLDFRYGSGQYQGGTVSDCATSATVGLAKAGFDHVNSEQHPSNTAVYGQHEDYTGVAFCTKAASGTTYAEIVFGPAGDALDPLFKAFDKQFK